MVYKIFALALLFAGALSANAYSYGDLDITIDGDDYTIGSGNAQLDVNVGADSVKTDYQAGGQSASVDVANDSDDIQATISGNSSNGAQAGTANFTSSNGSLKLEVESSGFSSDDKKAVLNLEGNTLTLIKSDDDLDAYNSVVLESNPNVSTISVDGDVVVINYRHPAKFLGIWNASLNATARVENDTAVNINLPWYSFLFSTGKGDVEKTIQIGLENNAVVQVNAGDDVDGSLRVQNAARAINIVTSQVGGSNSVSISGSNGNGVNFGF